MSRWLPSFVSLQPGMVRPQLVTRDQVFLAAKAAIAAGLAWTAALVADPHSRPYFAPLAVLLIVQPTVYHSLSRAFQRVAGVVVGVAAALAVGHALATCHAAWLSMAKSGFPHPPRAAARPLAPSSAPRPREGSRHAIH